MHSPAGGNPVVTVASFVLAFLFSVVLVFTIINVADIC
jgi:hypothetical protein